MSGVEVSTRVRFEVDAGVALITIDRPEVRNAIDLPTAREIAAALVEHIVANPMLNGEVIRLDGAIRMAPR